MGCQGGFVTAGLMNRGAVLGRLEMDVGNWRKKVIQNGRRSLGSCSHGGLGTVVSGHRALLWTPVSC